VSVAEVARRHAVNASLKFKWLRDPRHAPAAASATGSSEGSRFLPVATVAEVKAALAPPVAGNLTGTETVGGYRMRIGGGHDPQALARLIRGLSARSRFRPTRGSGLRPE